MKRMFKKHWLTLLIDKTPILFLWYDKHVRKLLKQHSLELRINDSASLISIGTSFTFIGSLAM
jgi:hypothetical protein